MSPADSANAVAEREWSYGWSMTRIRKPREKAVARHLLEELRCDAALVDEAIADPTTNGWSVLPVTEC